MHIRITTIFIALLVLSACSYQDVEVVEEVYYPQSNRLPHEEVYSRVAWNHLPQPIALKSRENAPLLAPVIAFELPNANLQEAVEAVAQTIGYEWHYPKSVAKRKVRLRMVGTVEEILDELGKQANVKYRLDHDRRMVRVLEEKTLPSLPTR